MNTVIVRSEAGIPRALLVALLVNALWVNASEVFRYFAFVMPLMREALPEVPDVAPMSFEIFAIWGAWDTILLITVTGFSWMFLERFGPRWQTALLAGSLVWLAVFVIFWLALFNMALANVGVIRVALPLAWLEMVVASFITLWCMRRAR